MGRGVSSMGEVTLQTTVIFRGFAPVPRCKTRTCIDGRLGKGENYALFILFWNVGKVKVFSGTVDTPCALRVK